MNLFVDVIFIPSSLKVFLLFCIHSQFFVRFNAQARLALGWDFDVRHFDAFCVCLHTGQSSSTTFTANASKDNSETLGKGPRLQAAPALSRMSSFTAGRKEPTTAPFRLLCEWLLDLSRLLLDPREGNWQQPSPATVFGHTNVVAQRKAGFAFTRFLGDRSQKTPAALGLAELRLCTAEEKFFYFQDRVSYT